MNFKQFLNKLDEGQISPMALKKIDIKKGDKVEVREVREVGDGTPECKIMITNPINDSKDYITYDSKKEAKEKGWNI